MGTILAAVAPPKRPHGEIGPSNLLWVGCVLAALAMGMIIAFGINVLRTSLVFIFIPALAGGVLLYSRPLSRANPPSNPEWAARFIVAIWAIALWLVSERRGDRDIFVSADLPAIAGAMFFGWIPGRRAQLAKREQGTARGTANRELD